MDFSKHNQGISSVAVRSAPGGQSSICLGGGYGVDKDEKPMTGKIGSATVPTATKPVDEEEKKDEETKAEAQAATPSVAAGARP